MRLLPVFVTTSNSPSDHMERSPRDQKILNFCKTCHFIGIASYVLWVFRGDFAASLTPLGESVYVCLPLQSLRIAMKLSENCHPSKKKRVTLDPCCQLYTQLSFLHWVTMSNLKWDWVSNGPLKSHSMAAITCSWPAVSHHYFTSVWTS